MKPLSLNAKLMLGISSLVITSGLIIAVLGSYRYSHALRESAVAQGEFMCQSLAVEATDKILINDLVALQKLIHHQQSVNPAVAYIFVLHEGEVLAHTFEDGFPTALLGVNHVVDATRGQHLSIRSDSGEEFIDFAWPIFDS